MKIQQNTDIQLSKDEVVELLLAGMKVKHKKLLPVVFDPKNVNLLVSTTSTNEQGDTLVEARLCFPMIEQAGPNPPAEA